MQSIQPIDMNNHRTTEHKIICGSHPRQEGRETHSNLEPHSSLPQAVPRSGSSQQRHNAIDKPRYHQCIKALLLIPHLHDQTCPPYSTKPSSEPRTRKCHRRNRPSRRTPRHRGIAPCSRTRSRRLCLLSRVCSVSPTLLFVPSVA
jgi:hypothetical protein